MIIESIKPLVGKVVVFSRNSNLNKNLGSNYKGVLSEVDEDKNRIKITGIEGQKYWLDKMPQPKWFDLETVEVIEVFFDKKRK